MSQQTWSRPADCPPPRDSEDSLQLLTLMIGCCIRTTSWKELNWLSKKFCVQSWQKTLVWGNEVLHKSIERCSLEVGVPEIEENNLDCRQYRRCYDQRPQLRFITIAIIMHGWSWGKIHTIFPRHDMDWQKKLLYFPSKLPIITITITAQKAIKIISTCFFTRCPEVSGDDVGVGWLVGERRVR